MALARGRRAHEDIQQRDGRWCQVDLAGKGNRVRTVPMPAWTKAAIDDWLAAARFAGGPVLGAVNKGDRIAGQGMTAQSIYEVVDGYGKELGATLAPHDVRRHADSRTMPNRPKMDAGLRRVRAPRQTIGSA